MVANTIAERIGQKRTDVRRGNESNKRVAFVRNDTHSGRCWLVGARGAHVYGTALDAYQITTRNVTRKMRTFLFS